MLSITFRLLNERGHRVASTFGRVLNRMLLKSSQISETFSTPHTLKLGISGMHALMLGQVLTLLEALVTAGTLIRLLPGVNASMPLHLRGVLEAFFAVGTLQRFFP